MVPQISLENFPAEDRKNIIDSIITRSEEDVATLEQQSGNPEFSWIPQKTIETINFLEGNNENETASNLRERLNRAWIEYTRRLMQVTINTRNKDQEVNQIILEMLMALKREGLTETAQTLIDEYKFDLASAA